MTAAMKKRVDAALRERGLSIDAFCDDPDEMTNDEARSLLRMLPKMFKPAEMLVDLGKVDSDFAYVTVEDETAEDEEEGRCLD